MEGSILLKVLGAALAIAASIAGAIWWLLKQCFVTKDDHRGLVTKHDELDKRVTSIETAIKNLPTITHHNELYIKLVEMGGTVKSTDEKVNRIQHQTDRTEDYLLKRGFNQ